MRHILRHGRLGPSLQRLVGLLRDTLPIAAELEDMRVQSEKEGDCLDTFAKAAGWYRVLYSDLRHALDFRLMTEQRVAILDASYSLFPPGQPPVDNKVKKEILQSISRRNSLAQGQEQEHDMALGLRPIPGFSQIITDAIRDATFVTHHLGNIAPIDVGVVCEISAVRVLGRAIHDRVRERLKG